MNAGLPIMKNMIQPLAKSVLVPLELAAASATDSGIHVVIRFADDNINNIK